MSSEATGPTISGPAETATTAQSAGKSSDIVIESRRKVASKRILVWLLFGAIFGLMPLFAVALKEALSPNGFSFEQLLKNGDLFIVSAVLAAGAIGELLASASRGMSFYLAVISGFFCLATFAGDTIAYVVAESAQPSEVVTFSVWFFPLTLLASGLCVGTAAYS